MFFSGALLSIEASFLADISLRKLRTAIFKVVWSRSQPLANVGAVLNLLDGPQGCDPAFCVVWFRFRMLRRYLAYWPGEVARVYRLLDSVAGGCPGHGPVHLLVDSAAEIRCQWNYHLSNLACPIRHFRAAVLEAWRVTLLLIFVFGRLSVEARGSMFMVPCSSLTLTTFWREIRHCFGVFLLVAFWNGFLLGKVRGQPVPCRFCGGSDGDGHLFWDCTHPPLVKILEHPEFHGLMVLDKSYWSQCLLWHGWLLLLSGIHGGSFRAENPAESAAHQLECALGSFTFRLLTEWHMPVEFDAESAASRVPDEPDVWPDGSLVQEKVSGTCSSGSGVFFSSSWSSWG